MGELELVRCGVRAAVVFAKTRSAVLKQEAAVGIDRSHTSLQQMISEERRCEMAMSSWCVRRAGRVVVVAGRDDGQYVTLTGFLADSVQLAGL